MGFTAAVVAGALGTAVGIVSGYCVASPSLRGRGPGLTFAERNEPKLQATVHFLSLLPAEIVRKIGRDNAVRLYNLRAT